MSQNEATARIKINKLLEAAGWRFFDDDTGKANIQLEQNVKITETDVDAWGNDFEKTKDGFLDFLLLDDKGFPFIVLEAKREGLEPLVAKEQARRYAKKLNCRFVILSNGNLHYFWDLERGNPSLLSDFPKPESLKEYQNYKPDRDKLIREAVNEDYITLTQMPDYATHAAWKNEGERDTFIDKNKLRFLRPYQEQAVHEIQKAVKNGEERFLFEMATGTGKTLTAAAVIKLFLRSGNARRVLFLVDRLELEDQAQKAFKFLLKSDYKTVIYKANRQDWHSADIVVTTVQSLLYNNKYQRLFSPTDFDLVISDEAHRSIGGNARAVFEYFIGYKLGLTATPKDYLKKFDEKKPTTKDPREFERRMMLDTYRIFGCESGDPTFRYSLLDGVKDGFLINPVLVDARTEVTTELLSEEGFVVEFENEDVDEEQETYKIRAFEKRFFSEETNTLFCMTFLKNALRDPVTGEVGKTIIFGVSQNHARKLTQLLNILADKMFPDKYQSNFAVQVTSQIPDAQQYTINFANNNLLGNGNFNELYKTSKARVCVTVGMMTTGYDCPDLLNLCIMRPIFSPTDFIQIKGRGTRKHNFLEQLFDNGLKADIDTAAKQKFKLFDFFAVCEYFEDEFDYDEQLKLPNPKGTGEPFEGDPNPTKPITYDFSDKDYLEFYEEEQVGFDGMKVDRMFFSNFEEKVKSDPILVRHVEREDWDTATHYVKENILDNPKENFTLERLRRAANVDRRLGLREMLEKAFGLIAGFKPKDQLLDEEFAKFVLDQQPHDPNSIMPIKHFFKAYITDNYVRSSIEENNLIDLNSSPAFNMQDYRAVPEEWRKVIPEYVKDYVSINRFMH